MRHKLGTRVHAMQMTDKENLHICADDAKGCLRVAKRSRGVGRVFSSVQNQKNCWPSFRNRKVGPHHRLRTLTQPPASSALISGIDNFILIRLTLRFMGKN